MDLNEGRKIIVDMQECFLKENIGINSENENNDHHFIEFTSMLSIENIKPQKFVAKFYYQANIVELSFYLHLEYDPIIRDSLTHLLNTINMIRNETFWSLCDCCNEIEMRYATKIDRSLSKKYFRKMIKKSKYLARKFTPLILKQIESDKNPYDLANEFFMENEALFMPNVFDILSNKNNCN